MYSYDRENNAQKIKSILLGSTVDLDEFTTQSHEKIVLTAESIDKEFLKQK